VKAEEEKEERRREKEREGREGLCSTSLPGGNQVDGLPPAPNTPAGLSGPEKALHIFVSFSRKIKKMNTKRTDLTIWCSNPRT